MATMLASKGRFLVLVTGLLAIVVYLGIALSWSEGLPMAPFAESKSEQPTVEANDTVIEVEEESDESNVDQPKAVSVPAVQPDVKASKSNGPAVGQITTQTRKTNTETLSHTLADTADTSVKVAPNPANPLDDSIDPDVPGIAKLALTADFQSLLESGVDVSTAVRFIDERIGDGKYGDEITRK
jgi:hypothetical protein